MNANAAGFYRKGCFLAVLVVLCTATFLHSQAPDQPVAPERLISWQSQASFGMVGLTMQQTARLNVAWVSTGCPLHPRLLASGLLPEVSVHLLFLDRQGNPLARQTVQLRPGQADALNLTGSAIPADQFRGSRTSVRAVALVPPIPFALLRPCLPTLRPGEPPPVEPPSPPETPRIDGGTISVGPDVVPFLSLYPIPAGLSDSSFKLTVEIFDNFSGETKLVLENPSFVHGISPWPLAIAPDGSTGSTGGRFDISPP